MKFFIFATLSLISLPAFAGLGGHYQGQAHASLTYSSGNYPNESGDCSDYDVEFYIISAYDGQPPLLRYLSHHDGCKSVWSGNLNEVYTVSGSDLYLNGVKVGSISSNSFHIKTGTPDHSIEITLTENTSGMISVSEDIISFDSDLIISGDLSQQAQ